MVSTLVTGSPACYTLKRGWRNTGKKDRLWISLQVKDKTKKNRVAGSRRIGQWNTVSVGAFSLSFSFFLVTHHLSKLHP